MVIFFFPAHKLYQNDPKDPSMSAKTKIVVLRMKEIIYTAIFIGFALLLILLFFIMFRPKKETPSLSEPAAETPVSSGGAASAGASDVSSPLYKPGLYSSPIVLGSQNVNVEVTVSSDQITSVSLVPLSDSNTRSRVLNAAGHGFVIGADHRKSVPGGPGISGRFPVHLDGTYERNQNSSE